MEVRMGKYSSRKNIANKDGKTTWVTDVLTLTPFGEFSIKNPVFYCSSYWDVNYGYFKFENKQYYGFVDVSVRTKGGYLYSFTIDGLTTAYVNGCFNDTYQMVEYAPVGRVNIDQSGNVWDVSPQLEEDPRLPTLEVPEVVKGAFGHYANTLGIVLVTSQPGAGGEYSSNTPGVGCYLLTVQAYNDFVVKLGQAGTLSSDDPASALIPDFSQKLMASIIGVYAIPLGLVPDSFKNDERKTTDIYLTMIEDLVLGLQTAIRSYTITLEAGTAWAIPTSYNSPAGKTYDVDVSSSLGTLNADSYHGECEIVIPDAGTLRFTPKLLGLTEINKIGYSAYVDFAGGKCSYYLRVNGEDRNNVYFTSSFPVQVPLASFDYNYETLLPKITQGASSAFNSPSISTSPVTAAIAASFEIANTVIQNEGTSGVTGITGGTTTLTSHKRPYYRYTYFKKWDPYDRFKNMYGRPAHQLMNIGHLGVVNVKNGYIKTVKCDLPANGLPRFIVDEANAMLDEGAFIGMVNAPNR